MPTVHLRCPYETGATLYVMVERTADMTFLKNDTTWGTISGDRASYVHPMTEHTAQQPKVYYLTLTTPATATGEGAPFEVTYWEQIDTSPATTDTLIGSDIIEQSTSEIYDTTHVAVDAEAIKAKTDNLPADPAATSDIGSEAASAILLTPANKLATDASNRVTVGTNADKTAYTLSATGLDSIPITAPSGVASDFREMVVQLWRRFFGKATVTTTELKTYAADGTTVLTTQTVSDDGTTNTQGESS